MRRPLAIPVALVLLTLFGAPAAQADPLFFNIGTCHAGACGDFALSGGGSIEARMSVINETDLLITLTNALNADAPGDDPYLTNLGFEYGSLLSGLVFSSFTVLSGTVATPTFTVDSTLRTFHIDFGFGFSDDGSTSGRDNRFQAMDPNEVVQIVVGTTSNIDLAHFQLGIAKVAGAGVDGRSGAITLTGTPVSVPEPGSLMALLAGLGTLTAHRKLRRRRTETV
jgi:hypothetical protein